MQSNKWWVGTCLYQEWCKPLLISCEAAFGYEQVAKRIANIRLTMVTSSLHFTGDLGKNPVINYYYPIRKPMAKTDLADLAGMLGTWK